MRAAGCPNRQSRPSGCRLRDYARAVSSSTSMTCTGTDLQGEALRRGEAGMPDDDDAGRVGHDRLAEAELLERVSDRRDRLVRDLAGVVVVRMEPVDSTTLRFAWQLYSGLETSAAFEPFE